tara:strand:- start:806 stop:1876 length:1071 start_codon:yes stop_codon:yes gene_type:complete
LIPTGIEILKSLLEERETKQEKTKLIKRIADDLTLAQGTVKRWLDLEDVPVQYQFDMMRLSGMDIDYSNFTAKQKDQFFTPRESAAYCVEKSINILSSLGENIDDLIFIEPSAGDGSFLHHLPSNQTIAMDIDPKSDSIHRKDFLTFNPDNKSDKSIVLIGNPPFGLRGNLALRFMNHASTFADYICFILPQLFESDGKGSPRKRVNGLNLYHTENLKTDFYDPSGRSIPVKVIFQVWSKKHINKKLLISGEKSDKVRVYSLSLGNSPSQIRNKDMIGKCDAYLPSTCYGETNMRAYSSFEDLPGRKGYGIVLLESDKVELKKKVFELNWAEKAFLSTNSALNLRTSMINEVIDNI